LTSPQELPELSSFKKAKMDTKSGPPPNYYAILEVPENATQAQIRNAYKR